MKKPSFEDTRRVLFVVLALAAVTCAGARVYGITTVDRDVLIFLLAAGVFLVLERVRKFTLNKDGISYELEGLKEAMSEVKKKVSEVRQVSVENQLALTEGVGGKRLADTQTNLESFQTRLEVVPNDPQKNQFGKVPSRNDRVLTAEVEPAIGYPGNYHVRLEVKSTKSSKPLAGKVTFYLHNTFKRPVREIAVKEGVARLELLCYGAFTVGAVADDGQTQLELDLSEDMRFPQKFRES